MSFTLAFILFLGIIFGIGFASPMMLDTDFVITSVEVPNLDYISMPGSVTEFMTPAMEGMVIAGPEWSSNTPDSSW